MKKKFYSHKKQDPFWKQDPSPEFLREILVRAGIKLKPAQLEKLWAYHQLYRQYNNSHDLSRLHSFQSIAEKHYLDCLCIKPFLPHHLESPVLDLGSGGGLPGLFIKLLYPQCNVILGEPRPKKVEFMEMAIKAMGFVGVEVFSHKVSSNSLTQPVKTVVSRAFASIENTLPLIENSLVSGGLLILMKGPALKEELETTDLKDYKLIKKVFYQIPSTDHPRSLAILQRQ